MYDIDPNKRYTWARFIQHVTKGQKQHYLPKKLGEWKDTSSTEFLTFCKSDDTTIIHKDGKSLYYYKKAETEKGTKATTYKRMDPPEEDKDPNQYH